MTVRTLLALLACGASLRAADPPTSRDRMGAAFGSTAYPVADFKMARDGKAEFAPRGADARVPGVPSYFQPFGTRAVPPFARTAKTTFQDTIQLVFLARTRPVRVEVKIVGPKGSLSDRWEAALRELFSAFDRDGDGFLNRHEVERIFTKAEFKQMAAGGYAFRGQTQGALPSMDALDRDGDGRVSFDEFADYYEGEGATLLKPKVTAVPNYNQQADQLTPELFARFDADGDGKLTEAELKNAERVILALDADEDECVTAAEILANPVRKLVVGKDGVAGMAGMNAMPGMMGPNGQPLIPGAADFQAHAGTVPGAVVQQLFKKYDKNDDFELTRDEIGFDLAAFDKLDANKDGKLSATELDAWRIGPPDLIVTLTLGTDSAPAKIVVTPEKGTPAVTAVADGQRAMLLVGTQTVDLAPYQVPDALRQQQNPYAYAFPQGKEALTEADLIGPQNQFLRVIFEPADFDGDGKLTRAEFDRYFALQRIVGELAVSLGHSTRVPNLFQLIDQNGDGKLSARELRTAYARLAPLEPTGGKAITKAILQPSAVVRIGPALTGAYDATLFAQPGLVSAPVVPTKGPVWFRKMDRNGDGDVSRVEFLGTKEQFDAIDANRDGLITLDEAEAFDKKAREKK